MTCGSFWLCRVSWRLWHCWHRPVFWAYVPGVPFWLLCSECGLWPVLSSPGERMPPFPVRASAWISQSGRNVSHCSHTCAVFPDSTSWGVPRRGVRRNPWSALQRSGACCGGFELEHCTPARDARSEQNQLFLFETFRQCGEWSSLRTAFGVFSGSKLRE